MRPPIHVTEWAGPPSPSPAVRARAVRAPAVLVHGTFSWATLAFEHQRPLARDRRLLLPDRRGFGDSPDLDGDFTSDYAVDAADILGLMTAHGPRGVHLVGHSYGGTVAMLAAAARPDLVRSLTLVEPCAHSVAAHEPVVAAAIEDARRFMAGARKETPEQYLETAYGNGPRPEPADRLLRAARTALHERPCWLADLATAPLREAGFPKLVIVGDWQTKPGGFRPGMASVMRAVCTTVADRIGGRLVALPGATHEPQREQPEAFNTVLANLWSDN